MKSSLLRGWGVAVLSGILSLTTTTPLLHAADQVVLAKQDINSPVTLTDSGNSWTLDNGIVQVIVNKTSGQLRVTKFKNFDTATAGGNWEQSPSGAAQVQGLTASITVDPSKNNGDRAEVSVKGITGGKIGLSPNSPGQGAQGTENLDLELRTTMGRGESGVYTYAIFSHPKEYGPLNVPESRFIAGLNREFDWISVDADRNMLECAPTDWGTGVVVHAKEQRIMSKGVYKNSVEHKYSYNAVQYKIPAYGWSSTKSKVGIWFINPSIEYLSGGATKQELVCHFGDNANPTPIILDYWRGTHYDGGAQAAVPQGEQWSKVIGPIFIYFNNLSDFKTPSQADLDTLAATAGDPTVPSAWKDNATALWQDALSQAAKEKAAWPYAWVQHPDYVQKKDRGSVSGQIVLNDPQAKTTQLPHLTVGLAHPEYARSAGGFGARRGAATAPGAGGLAIAPTTGPARRGGAGGFARGGPATTGPARGGFGGNAMVDWKHDAKFYQFWNDGTDDGKFTVSDVIPGKYNLYAFADGVLGEFAKADITVEAGKSIDIGKIEWKPVRHGQQVWEIGYPSRETNEFFKGDGANYWLWGWYLRYALLFPNDLTYTIGKSTPGKDWFFEQVPHATSLAFVNPEAKDPANQRFGWVKAESLQEYPQVRADGQPNSPGPWAVYGRGRATTWTIKFNMDHAPKGAATLRVALSGSDGNGGLAVGVNGADTGTIRTQTFTNALRYNTDKGVWYEYSHPFDASKMKQGENELTLTVPAGETTSGAVYDYLRLELDENAAPPAAPTAAAQ